MAIKDKIIGLFSKEAKQAYLYQKSLLNNQDVQKFGSNYFYPLFGIGGMVSWLQRDHKTIITEGFNKTADMYAIINYIVESAVNVPFGLYEYDNKGNKKKLPDDHKYMELINYPNELDSGKELRSKYLAYYLVLGNSLLNKVAPIGFKVPTQLYVLPPQHIDIYTTDNTFYGDFRTNDIKAYCLNLGQKVWFSPDEIWHKRKINLEFENGKYLIGLAPFLPGNRTMTSLKYNDEAKAGIMKNHGAGGILTNDSDQIELGKPDIEAIKEDYKKAYGFSYDQDKIIITAAKMKWQQMALPIDKLQLIENAKEDYRRFCRLLNFSSVLLGDDGSTAYNNIQSAEKRFYRDNLKPLINECYADLTEFIIGKKSKIRYEAEWHKVEALQDDLKEKSQRLAWEFDRGILTRLKYQQQMGYEYEENPALDEYYISSTLNVIDTGDEDDVEKNERAQQIKMESQASLRGTVGGVEGLLSIQNSVANKITEYSAGVAMLVEIYGFDEETAKRVLGSEKKQQPNTNQQVNETQNIQDNQHEQPKV